MTPSLSTPMTPSWSSRPGSDSTARLVAVAIVAHSRSTADASRSSPRRASFSISTLILWTRRPDPAAAPDANYDLMLEFMNVKDGGEWASVPAVGVYAKDLPWMRFGSCRANRSVRTRHSPI